MFKIINEKKKEENFKLHYGDILVMGNGRQYLIVCDGFGQYYFIRLNDGFIYAEKGDCPTKVNCERIYNIGDEILNSIIKEVIRKKRVNIEVYIDN